MRACWASRGMSWLLLQAACNGLQASFHKSLGSIHLMRATMQESLLPHVAAIPGSACSTSA